MRRSARKACLLAAIGVAVALAALPAAANDVAFGGAGADLVPLADGRVQMVSEDILLERVAPHGYRILGEGYWRIRACYRFANLTGEPLRIRIGFPEPACPEEADCRFTGFQDMETTVRGKPVAMEHGEVSEAHPWSARTGRVHLFEVAFAPHETVEVMHGYRHGLSEHVNGGEELLYLTRTGAPWAGPIERARFRIRLPFRPWGTSLGGWAPHLVGLEETRVEGHSQSELVFERKEWEPEDDLALYLGPGAPTPDSPGLLEGCPGPGDVPEPAPAAAPSGAAAAPQAPSREKLRLCRNAVFAHHGRAFRDPALEAYFYGETGLRVHRSAAAPIAGDSVFARNPDYSPALLSPAEQEYVEALRRLERGR